MLGQQLSGGIPRGAARQSEDEVGVLGHYRHYGWTCHPLHRIRTSPPERSAGPIGTRRTSFGVERGRG
jgi:hypothetical protein